MMYPNDTEMFIEGDGHGSSSSSGTSTMASKRGSAAVEGAGDNDGADFPETKKKRGNNAVVFVPEDTVQVTGGQFRNYIGTVKSVDTNAGTVKLSVSPTSAWYKWDQENYAPEITVPLEMVELYERDPPPKYPSLVLVFSALSQEGVAAANQSGQDLVTELSDRLGRTSVEGALASAQEEADKKPRKREKPALDGVLTVQSFTAPQYHSGLKAVGLVRPDRLRSSLTKLCNCLLPLCDPDMIPNQQKLLETMAEGVAAATKSGYFLATELSDRLGRTSVEGALASAQEVVDKKPKK